MNRLQYILTAKTQYDIQSPFLFELYSEVLNPRLGREERQRQGLTHGDTYAELRYKLMDRYEASVTEKDGWDVDELFMSAKHGLIGLVRKPHVAPESENRWRKLVQRGDITLSVDLFDVGIIFTDDKLSKQHFLLRCQ